MRYYRPRYFQAHELVPPDVFKQWGDRALMFMDPRLLWTLDQLRAGWGPITVNDYAFGGIRVASGLRLSNTPHYRPFSQHSFGRAADCLFRDVSVKEVRKRILLAKHTPAYQYIRGVELDVDWLHIDVRNTPTMETFKP